MDPKASQTGSIITGVLLLVVAGLVLPLAIGLIGTYPERVWMAGIFLFLMDLLFVYAAVRSFRQRRLKVENSSRETIHLKKGIASLSATLEEAVVPVSNAERPLVLVNWSPTADEWKQFVRWETRERKMNTILVGIGLAVGSAVFIHLLKNAGWGVSLIVGGGVAVIYSLISYQLTMSVMGKPIAGHYEIIISTCSVLMNNRLTIFVSDRRWATACEILEEPDPKILKIDYCWNTRNGTNSEEIHIPIPKGKLGEAVRLVEALNQSFASKHPK